MKIAIAGVLLAALGAGARSAPAAAAPAEPVVAAVPIQLSGYLQAQLVRDVGEGANAFDAEIRRARLKATARPRPRLGVVLEIDVSRDVEARDVYVQLGVGRPTHWMAGQFRPPFAYQFVESTTARVTPEVALVNDRLFAGERDRGALLTHALGRGPAGTFGVQVGAFQGAGPNTRDNNNDKDVLASFYLAGAPFSARVSYYKGWFTNPAGVFPGAGQKVDKDRFGADAQLSLRRWEFQGQWSRGEGDFVGGVMRATPVEGWYVQAIYKPAGLALFPYLRGQGYDPDRDTPGDTITGLQLGAAYDANPTLRYTLAWERRNDRARPGERDMVTARVQARL